MQDPALTKVQVKVIGSDQVMAAGVVKESASAGVGNGHYIGKGGLCTFTTDELSGIDTGASNFVQQEITIGIVPYYPYSLNIHSVVEFSNIDREIMAAPATLTVGFQDLRQMLLFRPVVNNFNAVHSPRAGGYDAVAALAVISWWFHGESVLQSFRLKAVLLQSAGGRGVVFQCYFSALQPPARHHRCHR